MVTPPSIAGQKPLVFDATASSIIAYAEATVNRTSNVWDSIVAKIQPANATFANVIQPIIDDNNVAQITRRVLLFYRTTSPEKALRDASGKATTMFNNADVELFSRRDMFALVDAVEQALQPEQVASLDQQSRYFVTKLHQRFLEMGCGLTDPQQRSALERSKKRLQEVTRELTTNLHQDTSGIWLEEEELEGMSSDFIARLEKGTGQRQGQVWLKTKLPHPNSVLVEAARDATRRKVFYAIKNRLPQNIPLFRELVTLRDEVARLLGWPNYFAYRTNGKMMRTPGAVKERLEDIRSKIGDRVVEDNQEFLALKKHQGLSKKGSVDDDSKLFFWDYSYYSSLRKDRNKNKDVRDSEYFELWHTLSKLLDLFGHLFDTRFECVSTEQQKSLGEGKPLVWHEDVIMYAVWDKREAGGFLGYAYLDLFPRDAKYGHSGCYSTQWGYESPEGNVCPSAALVMNYTKPTDSMPTLLRLEDARKLFHELGHLHHSLCTKVKHASLSEADRDFVEIPSIMFEQFLWTERHIKDLSHHYSYLSPELKKVWQEKQGGGASGGVEQPPVQLPDEAVTALATATAKEFIGSEVMNLFFSLYDVLVHSPESAEDLERLDLAEAFNKLHCEVRGMHGGEALGDGWAWSQGQSVFRMISGDYGGVYYSYVLGKVFALDMWQQEFAKDSTSREAGKRFRDTVLQPGGSQPEMDILTNYLGREPRMDAYFAWLGV